MATLITGISTAGLSSSPDPHVAFQRRRDNPGEYSIRVNATTGIKLELVTSRDTLYHFTNHLRAISGLVDTDLAKWRMEWLKLDTMLKSGVDLRGLA